MIITTSRKPSRRTRSFSKALSAYLGAKYITRGKRSFHSILQDALMDDGHLIVVSERHANPSKLTFFREEEEIFWISFTTSNPPKLYEAHYGEIAVHGSNELARDLSLFLHATPERTRKTIEVGQDTIKMRLDDEPVIVLYLRGYKNVERE